MKRVVHVSSGDLATVCGQSQKAVAEFRLWRPGADASYKTHPVNRDSFGITIAGLQGRGFRWADFYIERDVLVVDMYGEGDDGLEGGG